MSPIRLGAWGLGRIGSVHAKHFGAQADMYTVVAGCDVEQPKVERLRGGVRLCGVHRARRFPGHPNVELVIIATRSLTHVANALQALAAGKFVLLEKPIAMSS